MNKAKRHYRVAEGKARWQASRLEGVVKNRGTTKVKKEKGKHKEHRMRKIVTKRASKRR